MRKTKFRKKERKKDHYMPNKRIMKIYLRNHDAFNNQGINCRETSVANNYIQKSKVRRRLIWRRVM